MGAGRIQKADYTNLMHVIQAIRKQIASRTEPDLEQPSTTETATTPVATETTTTKSSEKENKQKENQPEKKSDAVNDTAKPLFEYFKGSIKFLIEKSKEQSNSLIKAIVANVSNRLKEDLHSRGIDVTEDYKHTIDNNAIRHALNRHGSEKERLQGQLPITEEDIENISDVVNNYDDIDIEENKREQKTIVYKKSYPDGTTIYIEEVRTGRKELAMASIRKKATLTDANSKTTPTSDLSNLSSTGKDTKETPESQEKEKKSHSETKNKDEQTNRIDKNDETGEPEYYKDPDTGSLYEIEHLDPETPKNKKISPIDFVLKNKKELKATPKIGGVFHDGGFAVATDSHILAALKMPYDKNLEGKIIDKNQKEIEDVFPNWRRVIPEKEQLKPYPFDPEVLHGYVTAALKKKESEDIAFQDADGTVHVYNLKNLDLFLHGVREIGGEVYSFGQPGKNTERLYTYSDKGMILMAGASLKNADPIFIEIPQKEQNTTTTKETTNQANTQKIEDVGEQILGARKDFSREVAKSFDNVTIQSLIEHPFGKVFKKPNLKKAVENGAIREKDAMFYDALFLMVNTQKPKVTQREMRNKRYKTNAEKWAEETFRQMEVLRRFLQADEAGRDAIMEQMLADHYPTREAELAMIEKRKEWNPDENEWGDKTTPNPLWITLEVLKKLEYSVGDKIDIPYGEIKANTSGTGYSIENQNGMENYLLSNRETLDEAIDTIVYLTQLKRGDSDLSHPTELFSFHSTKNEMGESGRYRVMWGRDYKTQEFDSKEQAEAFAQTKKDAHVFPIMEVKRQYGYMIKFKNPLTKENIFADEAEFDTRSEAAAYFDENFEKINEAVNKKMQEEREKKGEKKEITADDVVKIVTSYSAESGTTHAVVIDSKYADNDGRVSVIKDGFPSRKEAREFADKIKNEVLNTVLKHKKEAKKIVYFDTGENSRIGEDYRGGKDVEAEDFMNTFGFRGVQFGNWTNQQDRQMAVNQAYDAFMDMANLIGVSPQAISLNGELGIAFGSRGTGSASAHYEYEQVVINLTKTKGAGTLAHEWWHALDNYFARREGAPFGMVTEYKEIAMRDELRKAFNDMLDLVQKSDYAKRSIKKGEYWGRTREITARLFAEWVDQELKKQGELNTFLSRGANVERGQEDNYSLYAYLEQLAERVPKSFEEYKEQPESLKGIPFPTEKEVEEFGESLRNIFDTIEERIDEETGKTVLFQMIHDQGNTLKNDTRAQRLATEAVLHALETAGIPVEIVSDKQAQAILGDAENSDISKMAEKRTHSLSKAASFVSSAIKGKAEGRFTIELPLSTINKIKNIIGSTFTEHSITANSIVHSKKNHGIDGRKTSEQSIPLRDEDFSLLPYIMVSPDRIAQGSMDASGRKSIRFEKDLSNGYVVVVEKEQKNSPDDMETITMWAEKSSKVADARRNSSPAIDVQNVILSTDAAKIRKEAEEAIKNDVKKNEKHIVYHGSQALFDEFDHTHMGEGEGNRIQFMRTPQGTIYGWTIGGRIYLTRDGLNPNTPIHEYTHIWANAMMQHNPEGWADIKRLLRDTPVWEQVLADPNYADLRDNEDSIASETLSRISGRENARRVEAEAQQLIDQSYTIEAKTMAATLLMRIREAIRQFWNWVGKDLFGIKQFKNIEEVTDRILYDLAIGTELNAHSQNSDEELHDINQRFNEVLRDLTEENADNVTLWLGNPSDILLSAGVEDKAMKLYGNKVIKKMKKHGFTLEELRNLPNAVADPIAVFKNYGKEGNRSILTELTTNQGNVLVTLSIGKSGDIDFNIVSSVFGKGSENIVDWIEKDFSTYINKEKALNYLHHSVLKTEALSSSRLSSAAKIVTEFVNPKPFNKKQQENDIKASKSNDLTEEIAKVEQIFGQRMTARDKENLRRIDALRSF